MNKSKKVLVTGANGFIGRALVAWLLGSGYDVRAFVLPDEAVPESWQGNVEVARGDITDRAQVQSATENVGAVFHLAAIVTRSEREAEFQKVNVEGARNILELAAKSGTRAILLSSIAVYGNALDRDACDEDHAHGIAQGPYGRSKQAQERIALELAATQNLRVTIVRAGCVFGPNSFAWVDIFVHLLRRRLPVMIGDGGQNSRLCYLENLVALLALVLEKPNSIGRIYNALDDDLSWRDYLCELAVIVKAPAPMAMPRWLALAAARGDEWRSRFFPNPENLAFTRESVNLLGARGSVANRRARCELDFAPPVSHETAMREIEDYIHQKAL